jgi:hypothetical protein
MNGLRDFLEKQMASVRGAGEPLIQRREALRAELAEIDAKLQKLDAEWRDLETAAKAIGKAPAQDEPRKPSTGPTIKEAILTVLAEHPKGLSAGDLLREINTRFFDGQIKRTSFSPQMSRLKGRDRKVVQRGELYFRKAESPAFAGPS